MGEEGEAGLPGRECRRMWGKGLPARPAVMSHAGALQDAATVAAEVMLSGTGRRAEQEEMVTW